MKNWILSQWAKATVHRRWIALMFIQIWVWPQLLDPHMPAGFGFSLIITMTVCIIFNAIKMVESHD